MCDRTKRIGYIGMIHIRYKSNVNLVPVTSGLIVSALSILVSFVIIVLNQ
jgi:hypothetical protein